MKILMNLKLTQYLSIDTSRDFVKMSIDTTFEKSLNSSSSSTLIHSPNIQAALERLGISPPMLQNSTPEKENSNRIIISISPFAFENSLFSSTQILRFDK
jgi:hypothetical protein